MKKGFTMVELLVVLLIVGILAAVAAPIYLANTQRARASEAVAAMSLIRQAERDYRVTHAGYLSVAGANLDNDPGAATPGLGISLGTTQYFPRVSYTVTAGGDTERFTDPAAVNFLISVDGGTNSICPAGSPNCAVKGGEVANYDLEMDDSGRIYVSYDGTNWSAW